MLILFYEKNKENAETKNCGLLMRLENIFFIQNIRKINKHTKRKLT